MFYFGADHAVDIHISIGLIALGTYRTEKNESYEK